MACVHENNRRFAASSSDFTLLNHFSYHRDPEWVKNHCDGRCTAYMLIVRQEIRKRGLGRWADGRLGT